MLLSTFTTAFGTCIMVLSHILQERQSLRGSSSCRRRSQHTGKETEPSMLKTVALSRSQTQELTCRALWTGAAPRYLGNRLGWMLTVPYLGILRNFDGRKLPYAAVRHRSGCNALRVSRKVSCNRNGRLMRMACMLSSQGWYPRLSNPFEHGLKRGGS